MKPTLSAAQKNLSKLPAYCFSRLLTDNSVIKIVAGESGYYEVPQAIDKLEGAEAVEHFVGVLNEDLGVTGAQREAMAAGSMFGWGIPAANPDRYNKDGSFKGSN